MSTFEDGTPKQELARVNATFQAQVGLPDTSETNGLLSFGSAIAKTSTGTILPREFEVDPRRRLRVDEDTLLFHEPWISSELSTDRWSHVKEVGFADLYPNPSALDFVLEADGDAGYTCGIKSYTPIPLMIPETEVVLSFSGLLTAVGGTQYRLHAGFIAADITETYFDEGVYIQFNDGTGQSRLVAKHNTNDTYANFDPTLVPLGWSDALIPVDTMRSYRFVVGITYIELWVGNEVGDFVRAAVLTTADYAFPVLKLTTAYHCPIMVRLTSMAYIPSEIMFRMGGMTVHTRGHFANLDNVTPTATSGRAVSQSQHTTFQSTANLGNGTTPTAVTLSNTTTTFTTLGGRFTFAAPAGAETDYVVCSFPLTNQYDLAALIRGVTIHLVNTGAAVATNPTIIEWFLGYGSTAASLATTESATTKADRRVYLGMQSLLVGSAIGVVPPPVVVTLNTPFYAPKGSHIKLCCRVFSGANTGSEVFRGAVHVTGDWVL